MKVIWCWRCRQDVPMLDEEEYEKVSRLYYECMRSIRTYRQDNKNILSDTSLDNLFEPVRREYEKITGSADCHHNAIMHHRISIYGPPCKQCGKPLRTPKAKYCAFCGKHI